MQFSHNFSMTFDNVLGKKYRFFYMGIAILWIVGYHLYSHDIDFYDNHFKILRTIFKYGYVGVDIFFFFSAYGLCYSYSNSSLKDFYKKRFIRIVPIYLIFEVIKFCIGTSEDLKAFCYHRVLEITSLFVIQTPITCPNEIRLGWFVPSIINLYLVFPLLFKCIRYLYSKRPYIQFIFIILLFFSCHFLWGYIHGLYISRIPIICVGIFTFFLLKDKKYDGLFLLYALFASLTYFIDRDNLRLSCLVPLILYAISMYTPRINELFFKGMSKVGEMTYEIFLAHCYVGLYCPKKAILKTWLIVVVGTILLTVILHFVNKKISLFLQNLNK